MNKTTIIFLLASVIAPVTYAEKVLVTIGELGQVSEQQLESAMRASPFATQFPAMDESDQAYLRGDMLLRLARKEALYQEALTSGINDSQAFRHEMSNFKTTLLAQRFLHGLRDQISIPELQQKSLEKQFIGHSDALIAANSAVIADQFKLIKDEKIAALRKQAAIQTFFQRLDAKPTAETVLAQGMGISIRYGDLVPDTTLQTLDKEHLIKTVNEWIDLTLMAQAAEKQGVNIEGQLLDYGHNLSVRLLLANKEKQWVGSEQVLVDYFQRNPNIAYIPERRQIGQIVLVSQEQAEIMRKRILAGESLFDLAGEYSIDPYGKQRSGDMGWLTEGSASAEIEQAIKGLKDNQVSEVIKTEKGWHLVVVTSRKPSERKDFAAIKDRVKQKFIAEKMTDYLKQVTDKYPLKWNIAEHDKVKPM